MDMNTIRGMLAINIRTSHMHGMYLLHYQSVQTIVAIYKNHPYVFTEP